MTDYSVGSVKYRMKWMLLFGSLLDEYTTAGFHGQAFFCVCLSFFEAFYRICPKVKWTQLSLFEIIWLHV